MPRLPGGRIARTTTATKKVNAIPYASRSKTFNVDMDGIPPQKILATADAPRATQKKPITMGRVIGDRMARTT
jgi:hypothetical protein